MEQIILVFLHVIGASVFIGGNLLFTISYLPQAVKSKDFQIIRDFRKRFAIVIFPSLAIQFLTGFRLAMKLIPISTWFSFSDKFSSIIVMKLFLFIFLIILNGVTDAVLLKRINEKNYMWSVSLIIFSTLAVIALAFVGLELKY